jgi:V8-like Glu-specific endopeptidase
MVCGSDGFTYASTCLALCQGARIRANGSCEAAAGSSAGLSIMAAPAGSSSKPEPISQWAMSQFAAEGYKLVGKAPTGGFTVFSPPNDPSKAVNKATVTVIPGGARYDIATGLLYRSLATSASLVKSSDAPSAMTPAGGDKSGSPSSGPQPGGNGTITGQLITGRDDRLHVTNGAAWPNRAMVYLQTDSGICSGVMISKRTVLTSAHCIYNFASRKWAKWAKATPGSHYTTSGRWTAPYGTYSSTYLEIPSQYFSFGSMAYDYGVVQLGSDAGSRTGWLGWRVNNGKFSGRLYTLGYPGDKRRGSQWSDWDWVSDTSSDAFIWCNLDIVGGQSGSPVYDGSLYMQGVIRGSQGSRNDAVAIWATDSSWISARRRS